MSGVVWIMGAGFSKSLGGPLLPALLSARSQERIRAAYGDRPRLTEGWEIDAIRGMLSTHGWEVKTGHPAWVDAEEFVEQLDTAAFGPTGMTAARRLLQIRSPHQIPTADHFEAIAAAAKRLVAAECCLFVRNADTNSERWRPYVNWARTLDGTDTVITFNYDRVVEMAAKAAGRDLDIVAGGLPVRSGLPRLLKMHGSVDWKRQGREYLRVDDPECALTCAADEIGIASPGPSKLELSEQWKGLWMGAEQAVREARAIVFVGYRFPPTDSYSRERLLGAVMQNATSDHVAVHTVLGPDTSGPDSRRLLAMLRYALGRGNRMPVGPERLPSASLSEYYSLIAQPLFAEDFLSLVQRPTIVDPLQDGPLGP